MKRKSQLDLQNVSWPMSVLKSNEAFREMQPGDQLVLKLADKDVLANVVQILNANQELRYWVDNRDTGCCIQIDKSEAP